MDHITPSTDIPEYLRPLNEKYLPLAKKLLQTASEQGATVEEFENACNLAIAFNNKTFREMSIVFEKAADSGGRGGEKMTRQEIRETLEKQLQILSERSQSSETSEDSLVKYSHEMLVIAVHLNAYETKPRTQNIDPNATSGRAIDLID